MENLYVIVGLGNPGRRYVNTRHNVGFEAIDALSGKYGIKVSKAKFKALTGEGSVNGEKVLLVKPQTYMNLSGECVREIVEWYKLPMNNLILIYDDADLPSGKVRIRPKGSSGTHNGMKSVIYHLLSDEFPRIRIGIGSAPEGWDLADYVLSRLSPDDGRIIRESIVKSAEAAAAIITSGIDRAMNLFNGNRADDGNRLDDGNRADNVNRMGDGNRLDDV